MGGVGGRRFGAGIRPPPPFIRTEGISKARRRNSESRKKSIPTYSMLFSVMRVTDFINCVKPTVSMTKNVGFKLISAVGAVNITKIISLQKFT